MEAKSSRAVGRYITLDYDARCSYCRGVIPKGEQVFRRNYPSGKTRTFHIDHIRSTRKHNHRKES